MPKDHNYFNDPDSNNEVEAMRAACREMNMHNLWMFAQRALITATEAQRILKERFPEAWEEFDKNAMGKK
jgi:hypothetical protein